MINYVQFNQGIKKLSTTQQSRVTKRDKKLKFLENNLNCYDRSNLDGHITVGALVCDKHGNILLNHHKK